MSVEFLSDDPVPVPEPGAATAGGRDPSNSVGGGGGRLLTASGPAAIAWCAAAVLLVVACFVPVSRLRERVVIPDFDHVSIRFTDFGFDAFGRVSGPLSVAPGTSPDSAAGTPYGYVWIGVIVLLAVAALRRRTRTGAALGVLSTAALLGCVVTGVLVEHTRGRVLGVGVSLQALPAAGAWLAAAATALALLGAIDVLVRGPGRSRTPVVVGPRS